DLSLSLRPTTRSGGHRRKMASSWGTPTGFPRRSKASTRRRAYQRQPGNGAGTRNLSSLSVVEGYSNAATSHLPARTPVAGFRRQRDGAEPPLGRVSALWRGPCPGHAVRPAGALPARG